MPPTAPPELAARLTRTVPFARLRRTPLPLTPTLALWLIDPHNMDQPMPHAVAQAVQAEPAYWSFCWASGQVLAQWLLANPAAVAGRTVVDWGSGSGVVAIAAARAGAANVTAVDSDADARAAVLANAALNGVPVTVAEAWPVNENDSDGRVDVLLAADVLYDPDNRPWLARFRQAAGQVWVADSRQRDLREPGYTRVTQGRAVTLPDLGELAEFSRVSVYRAEG